MFLLDTDHLGIIQRGNTPEFDRLSDRMNFHSAQEFFVSIISFHEQVLGWNAYIARARDTAGVVRAYGMFQKIIADFAFSQVLPFDAPQADIFDTLRAQRIRVATMGLRIAAIALAGGLTLLTRNLADFRRVPRLLVEDWTE